MPENTVKGTMEVQARTLQHRGRIAQVPIYFGKLMRMFIYKNDWKVFPMAAIIAGLVAMVIRRNMFVTMEGTLTGSFALSCVAIWNGCFNSIQVICRERSIVKREHRSGMHISSYIVSHMLYQILICLGQSIVTIIVCKNIGVKFPSEGMFTPHMMVDIGITIFLVTFAADMLSLLISALARDTTSAMTVMPFILIFQLIFSGGFFALPNWAAPLTKFTVSSYGLTCIASQADYNHLPMVSAWNSLEKLEDEMVTVKFTLGDVLDELQKKDKAIVRQVLDEQVDENMTLGDVTDYLVQNPYLQENRDREFTIQVPVGQVLELAGRDNVEEVLKEKTAMASQRDQFVKTPANIIRCWVTLLVFALIYALIAMIVLEFIDKDRR